MADEQATATQQALAVLGMIRKGQGVDVMAQGRGSIDSMSPDEVVARSLTMSGGVGGGNLPAMGAAPAMEHGVSLTDMASGAAAPAIGATAGALIGGRMGGYPGKMAGNAVGAAAGTGANALMGQPSPTGNALFDMILAAGGAVGGQMVGDVTAFGARTAARPFSPAPAPGATATRAAFDATGVPMKVSDVSPNMAPVERGLVQTTTGRPIIGAAMDRQGAAVTRASDDFLARLGPPQAGERMAVGQRASESIIGQSARTSSIENHMWAQLGQMAHDQPVNVRDLKTTANNVLRDQEQRLPGQRNAALMAQAREVLEHGDEVAWQRVDAWRKGFGEAITSGELISKVPGGSAKALYRAALTDMERSATAAGVTGLGGAFTNVRKFSERRREMFRDGQAAAVLETDPEHVVKMLNIAGGPTAIRRAREEIIGSPELGLTTPAPRDVETWNYVRRHILEGVFTDATRDVNGLTNPVILGSRLDKALSKIGRDGLRELLDPTELQALDNLAAVAKSIRSSERIGAVANTSATGQALNMANYLTRPGTLAGMGVGYLAGGPAGMVSGGVVGGYASIILVPATAAWILTRPTAARIVASPAFARLANITGGGTRALGQGNEALMRLVGVMAAERAPDAIRALRGAE